MGFDYALVHLKYTIPPAIVLTFLYRPFLDRLNLYKIIFLVVVAVVSTIPWDSYLIRCKIWTYPPNVILGPTLFSIPAEEGFFFVIQTYNTALLYAILSKPLFHPSYLSPSNKISGSWRKVGQLAFALGILAGMGLIWKGDKGTYLGLILVWASPFALLLWTLSAEFITSLPYTSTAVPIAIPTLYLWLVDTLALRRGTWSISSGTKLGIHVWDGLEIEEAIFFLATNSLIVLGLVAFDHALSILTAFPTLFPQMPELPSAGMLIKALLLKSSRYDLDRISGLYEAAERLQKKSRSFFLASSTFSGRLRVDLILLYSFCRVADDLIDNVQTESEASKWINELTHYLDLAYSSREARMISEQPDIHVFIAENFPISAQSSLHLLPTNLLSYGPLYDLLEGFRTDLKFHENKSSKSVQAFPIANEHDLEVYAAQVAGTVAGLCLELVFFHSPSTITSTQRDGLVIAGGHMGVALQYVNIARDIETDAAMGRVYLPTSWLKEASITPQHILENPNSSIVEKLRGKLLTKAFELYKEARTMMKQLPNEAKAPMRVAVECYMEIGRVLMEKGYRFKKGKATVPKMRRLKVVWKALSEN